MVEILPYKSWENFYDGGSLRHTSYMKLKLSLELLKPRKPHKKAQGETDAIKMELLTLPRVQFSPRHPLGRRHSSNHYGLIKCGGIAEPSGVPAPMGQKTQYKDGLFEKAFMSLFARKMEKFGSSGGAKKETGFWDWDYESFVDVSKRVMVGRSRKQQQEVVREVLLSMLPPGAPAQVPNSSKTI